MIAALWLLAAQGLLGAFDTVWYHEWRARLPWKGPIASRELALHAGRDFLYAIIFATLPRIEWRGTWTHVLVAILGAEIVITLTDFVVETYDRNVEAGELDCGMLSVREVPSPLGQGRPVIVAQLEPMDLDALKHRDRVTR